MIDKFVEFLFIDFEKVFRFFVERLFGDLVEIIFFIFFLGVIY